MSGMTILSIDPGPIESAYVVIHSDTCNPLEFGKVGNAELIRLIQEVLVADLVAIEMIASYGMSVGAEVFETCVWIGRFAQTFASDWDVEPLLIKRPPVKLHHTHSSKAKDANITQALVDRFAPGQPNHGKGTKANPGFFYGFRADIWQAFALAVYTADTGTT